MRFVLSSIIGGTVAPNGVTVAPVLMLPGWVPSSYTATTWKPAIMKLTVPPALMVTWFGMRAWTLLLRPAVATRFGRRLVPLAHAPKLTVAVASGPLIALWLSCSSVAAEAWPPCVPPSASAAAPIPAFSTNSRRFMRVLTLLQRLTLGWRRG